MGYDRDTFAGVLLSMEVTAEANRRAEAYSKSGKSKQDARRAKVPTRKPRKRK